MKKVLLLCAVVVACLVLSASTSRGDEKKRRFSGSYSGVKKAGEQVIEDAETWEKVWKEVHSTRSPQPKLPEVDFEKQVVLAVFLGEKFTGGYGIRITGVKDAGKVVEVSVKKMSPAPGSFTTQALTQPYDMLVVEKPGKPVKFVMKNGRQGPRRVKPGR